MRKGNKLLVLLLTLVLAFVITACGETNNDKTKLAEAKTALAIGFNGTDEINKVTQNVTLKTKEGEATVTWSSSNTEVISNTGVVARQTEDKEVTLTATLVVNEERDTKSFTLTVLKREETSQVAKQALIAHYAATLGNAEWKAVDNVELIKTIEGVAVTWASNNAAHFSNEGVVVRPTYAAGDATIALKATLANGTSHTFYFLVQKLDQTIEEKIDEQLNIVTIVPSTSDGYQQTNFDVTKEVEIDGEKVVVAWTSSNEDFMTNDGVLVPFATPSEIQVELTASITVGEVTRTKTIVFKLKSMASFASLKDALTVDNYEVVNNAAVGKKVFVSDVAFYKDITDGYYVMSNDNMLGFVYGNRDSAVVKAGKLYDIVFTIDVYYGTFQLKDVSFLNERDGVLPTITPVAMTLEQIVSAPKPSLTTPNQHTLYTLSGVKVRVDNAADNYKTFLVPVGLEAGATLTDTNSIMIYYKSNLDVIKTLDGKTIKSIQVINNGYRTNNVVWNVNFIGKVADIELQLTDQEVVDTVYSGWDKKIDKHYYKNADLKLVTTELDAEIAWTSSHPEIITAAGVITVPATPTTVTLTAVITKGDATKTLTREILVGALDASTVADLKAGEKGDYFKITAVVTGVAANGTFTFEDATGAIVVYTLRNVVLTVGKEYTITGSKDVYNGLVQLKQIEAAIEGEVAALYPAITLDEAALLSETLSDQQGHLVNIDKARIAAIDIDTQYGNVTLTLAVGEATITLKWDSRVVVGDDAKDHISGLKVNDFVNIVAAPLGWSKGALIGYNAQSQIVGVTLTDAEKLEYVAKEVKAALDGKVYNMGSTVALPEATTLFTGVAFAWEANENLVDGKLIDVTADTIVTLNLRLTLGEAIKDVSVTITNKSVGGPSVPTIMFQESFDDLNNTSSGYLKHTDNYLEGWEMAEIFNKIDAKDIGPLTGLTVDAAGILRFRTSKDTYGGTAYMVNKTPFEADIVKISLDAKYYNQYQDVKAEVFVSADGDTWTLLQELALAAPAPMDSWEQHVWTTFNLDVTEAGMRYVKILATGTNGTLKYNSSVNVDNLKIYK